MSKWGSSAAEKGSDGGIEQSEIATPALTFGTEVERYEVALSVEQQQAYRTQLDKAIRATAILNLELGQVFPRSAAKKASLCIIKRNGIPFMEVIFDDNATMNQLEFISIPYQDEHKKEYIGGVKKLEEFFTPENIKDNCEIMDAFPIAFENLATHQIRSFEHQGFTFEFPRFTKTVFKNVQLDDSAKGLNVHITHSLAVNNDRKYLTKLQEFLSEQRKSLYIPYHIEDADAVYLRYLHHGGGPTYSMLPKKSVLAKVSTQGSHLTSQDDRELHIRQLEMLKQKFPGNLLDQTFPPHLNHSWDNAERTNHQPLFKMPRDHLYEDDRQKNTYIQRVINREVLAPTSNLVEPTMHEIAIYGTLLEKIKAKIEQEKNASKKSSDLDPVLASLLSNVEATTLQPQLQLSKIKLEKTIAGLKEQVVQSVAAIKPELIKKGDNVDINYDKLTRAAPGSLANISIFDSFDEKLKQIGLCEHRASSARQDFSMLLQYRQKKILPSKDGIHDLDSYTTGKCATIIEHFKLLKEAHIILAEKTRTTAREEKTPHASLAQQQVDLPTSRSNISALQLLAEDEVFYMQELEKLKPGVTPNRSGKPKEAIQKVPQDPRLGNLQVQAGLIEEGPVRPKPKTHKGKKGQSSVSSQKAIPASAQPVAKAQDDDLQTPDAPGASLPKEVSAKALKRQKNKHRKREKRKQEREAQQDSSSDENQAESLTKKKQDKKKKVEKEVLPTPPSPPSVQPNQIAQQKTKKSTTKMSLSPKDELPPPESKRKPSPLLEPKEQKELDAIRGVFASHGVKEDNTPARKPSNAPGVRKVPSKSLSGGQLHQH